MTPSSNPTQSKYFGGIAGVLKPKYRPRNGYNYFVFSPTHPGFILGQVDSESGASDLGEIELIVSQIRRGIATEGAKALVCVLDRRNERGDLMSCNVTTLGALFGKPKNRGSGIGLRPIAEENRWKGKVDWEAERAGILLKISAGWSMGRIARGLGVSPSALSKANQRFELYPKHEGPFK